MHGASGRACGVTSAWQAQERPASILPQLPDDLLGGYLIGALRLLPLITAYLWTKERYVVVLAWSILQQRVVATGR
jgi:hypothetical protein